MKKEITIWHNELCSTSRRILGLLHDNLFTISVRDYLADPPTASELDEVLRKMNEEPLAIIRQKEPVFQQQFAGKTLSREEWLAAMSRYPILIERPIIIMNGKAWLGRPVEEFEKVVRSLAG